MKKALAMALVLGLVVMLAGCAQMDYKKAMSLYESGDYAQAQAMFEALGEYEDAA